METHICINCEKSFERRFDKRKTPQFCSPACFGKAKTKDLLKKQTKECDRCGTIHNKKGRFCGRHCANKRTQTDETKNKISFKAKLNPSGAILLNGNGKPRKCDIGRAKSKERICNYCARIYKQSASKNLKFCSKECYFASDQCGGFRENSSRCKKSIHNGYKMHSGSELQFAKLLDEHNIDWVKNSTQYFEFADSVGKTRKYYPDFYLPKYNTWVEIKGRYYIRPDDDLRRAAVGNIQVIYHDEIRLPDVALPTGADPVISG